MVARRSAPARLALAGHGPRGASAARRRHRLRAGSFLRHRPVARERGPASRGRHDRAAADALGARPARGRARSSAAQDRVARVREDRRAAGLPLLRQRAGGTGHHAGRARFALRRGRLCGRLAGRPSVGYPRRGPRRLVGGHRARRLVQRPPRLPAARVRPLARARRGRRERERRSRRRADARVDEG